MLKIVPVKMNEKEQQLFKEARAYAIMAEQRIGECLAEAIEAKIKHDDNMNE